MIPRRHQTVPVETTPRLTPPPLYIKRSASLRGLVRNHLGRRMRISQCPHLKRSPLSGYERGQRRGRGLRDQVVLPYPNNASQRSKPHRNQDQQSAHRGTPTPQTRQLRGHRSGSATVLDVLRLGVVTMSKRMQTTYTRARVAGHPHQYMCQSPNLQRPTQCFRRGNMCLGRKRHGSLQCLHRRITTQT